MRRFELIAPCHFGMESVLKREITDLGYDITEVADGRVTFFGDEEALCRANIFLRTAERILIKIGSFHAETFEELFQGTKNLPWEEYIPKDGKFWVAKAASVKSKLFSPSDIQSIMKKAMVERLKAQYEISWFPEDGENFPVRVFLMKDEVTVGLDSTGESLHKRGYRTMVSKAPIKETLAAALLMLTPWHKDRILVDPFCGSGTTLVGSKLLSRKFIGIDINPDAIDLCKKRLETPFKTNSNLLNSGIGAYKTKTEEEMSILKQFDCVVVQRNKGIDAFLKKYYLDAPVAIKIQKDDETFSDTVKALYRAGMKKNCSFMILITKESDWQNKDYNIPMNVIVLSTYETQFNEIIERKSVKEN